MEIQHSSFWWDLEAFSQKLQKRNDCISLISIYNRQEFELNDFSGGANIERTTTDTGEQQS